MSAIKGGDIATMTVKNTSLMRVRDLENIQGTELIDNARGNSDPELDNILSEEISSEQITARNDIEEMKDVVTQLIEVVESMKSDMSEKDEIIKQLSDKIDEKNRSN